MTGKETKNTHATNRSTIINQTKQMFFSEEKGTAHTLMKTSQTVTLSETNIAPENRVSQKESSIPTIHFQVLLLLVSGRVRLKFLGIQTLWETIHVVYSAQWIPNSLEAISSGGISTEETATYVIGPCLFTSFTSFTTWKFQLLTVNFHQLENRKKNRGFHLPNKNVIVSYVFQEVGFISAPFMG